MDSRGNVGMFFLFIIFFCFATLVTISYLNDSNDFCIDEEERRGGGYTCLKYNIDLMEDNGIDCYLKHKYISGAEEYSCQGVGVVDKICVEEGVNSNVTNCDRGGELLW